MRRRSRDESKLATLAVEPIDKASRSLLRKSKVEVRYRGVRVFRDNA